MNGCRWTNDCSDLLRVFWLVTAWAKACNTSGAATTRQGCDGLPQLPWYPGTVTAAEWPARSSGESRLLAVLGLEPRPHFLVDCSATWTVHLYSQARALSLVTKDELKLEEPLVTFGVHDYGSSPLRVMYHSNIVQHRASSTCLPLDSKSPRRQSFWNNTKIPGMVANGLEIAV